MPSRLQKSQKQRPKSPQKGSQSDFQSSPHPHTTQSNLQTNGAPQVTRASPSPSSQFNNSMSGPRSSNHPSLSTSSLSPASVPRMVQTIRAVPSFEAPSESSSDTPSRNSAFSSSVNSNASAISMSSRQDDSPNTRAKQEQSNGTDVTLRVVSDASPPRREEINPPPTIDTNAIGGTDTQSPGGWDSTVGKARLGKTGRVINKLVSDNDSLKREIQIEKLRAEEAKQAAKLVEDKMDRMINDYESRLLEASVTKTLLARKERQVETLKSTVEQEKKRAADAIERERVWRDEMDKMRSSTSRQVEEANSHAALMEGRYNAISSHWRDQGNDVKKAHLKLRGEIAGLVEERRQDDDKISMLRDLCDQQDANIRELRRQRDEIAGAFHKYKQEQEALLGGIKMNAARREAEQEQILAETREVLDKLKWSLNVKENVKGAG